MHTIFPDPSQPPFFPATLLIPTNDASCASIERATTQKWLHSFGTFPAGQTEPVQCGTNKPCDMSGEKYLRKTPQYVHT